MKKLYENIEDIDIKGGVSQLSEVVTAMDVSLQNIAENTERLTVQLIRYSTTNKGAQYERVVNTSMQLRDVLFQASRELNDMQNQVVIYQNKIYRYEDMSETAQKPNAYLVNRDQNVNVETKAMQFNRDEMIRLAAMLKNYGEKVFHHTKDLKDRKNAIANVWRDSQYRDFSEYIESVTREIVDALKVFDEYVVYLNEKIKELD